ncbi:MAG: T9SS type A sorting domain-containing protein [Gelidibacter sp.]
MKTTLHYKILLSFFTFHILAFSYAQASLVKDIYSGTSSSNPSEITKLQNTAVFVANASGLGAELWITDATTNGTQLLKDILPGTNTSGLSNLTKVNDVVFFIANDGTAGYELWLTDGTETGTMLVKDIRVGAGSSSLNYLTNVNGTLFFTASTDLYNKDQLWKSDGTEEGTILVKNIRPNSTANAGTGLLTPTENGLLFFRTNDGVYGAELWVSDGTESGTIMVKDIKTGPASGQVGDITAIGNWVYFSALGDNGIKSLWKSDGSLENTQIIEEGYILYNQNNINTKAYYNGKFYFSAKRYNTVTDTTGYELFVSDGTPEGTGLVKDINPGLASSNPSFFYVFNNLLYFQATTDDFGDELWVTDGTSEGTIIVKDINPGSNDSSPRSFTSIGNELYFTANDGTNGAELWKTNGTFEGTIRLTDIIPGASCCTNIGYITELNNIVVFGAGNNTYGSELWRLDQELSVVDNINLSALKIDPNPTSNFLNLSTQITDLYNVVIYNQLGQQVLTKKYHQSKSSIDVSNLSKGLYFLKVTAIAGNSQTIKFIKN